MQMCYPVTKQPSSLVTGGIVAEAASDQYESVPVPRRVKISSKRQITIPVDIYERQGFSEYAMLTETPRGLMIEPVQLIDDDEELTVRLLRYLVENGCEGEQLLEKYTELKPKFASYYRAVERSEADIREGRIVEFDEMQRSIEGKYGL